jgi:hypothetical protein
MNAHLTAPSPIKTITELIARLTAVHDDLDVRRLTLRQYEHVGWALRPIEGLLDRCREEAESIRFVAAAELLEQQTQPFARVLPMARAKGPRA